MKTPGQRVHVEGNPELSRNFILIALVALAATFFGVTFWAYTTVPLWWDECHTAWMIEDGWASIAKKCSSEVYPPLYFWFLSIWTSGFGDSEVALRFPSFLAAISLTVTSYWIGKYLKDQNTGLLAAGFVLVCPIVHYYAVEARCYMMLVALCSLAILLLFRYIDEPNRLGYLAGFGLSTLAMLYTHYYAVFFLPAVLTCLLFNRVPGQGVVAKRVILSLIGAFIVYSPWFYRAVAAKIGADWIGEYHWSGSHRFTVMLKSLDAFAVGGVYPRELWHISRSSLGLPMAGATISGMLIIFSWWGDRNGGKETTKRLVVLMSLSLIAAWLYSLLRKPIYIVGRYDLIGFAPFPVLVSLGLQFLWYHLKLFSVLFTLVIVALGLTTTYQMVLRSQEPNSRIIDRETVAFAKEAEFDIIVCLGYRHIGMRYYAKGQVILNCFPRSLHDHPGIYFPRHELLNYNGLRTDASELSIHVKSALEQRQRVGLAHYKGDSNSNEVLNYLIDELDDFCVAKPVGPKELMLFELLPIR